MRNIAIIPARSGSKGYKDKNIAMLCGEPLISYSIRAARNTNLFEKILVSTDSIKYANVAKEYGAEVPFMRSEETSTDIASSWDAVREVLSLLEKKGERFDNVMLLQPTSPLRSCQDICDSFTLFQKEDANSVVSVCEMDHSPLWSNTLGKDLCMDNFLQEQYFNVPRQQLPIYYRINGAIYLLKRAELFKERMFKHKCYAHIMDKQNSIDIDDKFDMQVAELFIERRDKGFILGKEL